MRLAVMLVLLGALAGLRPPCAPAPLVRPVQSLVVHYGAAGEPVTLSGQIQAQTEANLAFRIGGRLIERRVSVGDRVTPGQVVARIESQDPQNSLRSAQADLSASQATLVQARNNEARYRALVATGVISRAQYDEAQQQLAAAQSRVTAAEAAARTARDNVGYTELRSDVAGVVTGKGAEPGEVVQAGQMIVQVAQKGGKDAVFNVPALLMREAPKNPSCHGRPERRPAHQRGRPRARGLPAGRSHHRHLPREGRAGRSTRDDAPGCDRGRQHHPECRAGRAPARDRADTGARASPRSG